MLVAAEPLQIPLREEPLGTYCVANSRITLDTVLWEYKSGAGAEEISRNYELDPADVHAVIAYYLRHRAEIDEYLTERDTAAEERRRKAKDVPEYRAFIERMIDRAGQMGVARD